MCVVIGSGTPARSATSVDQPAVALTTVSHSMSPRVVSTARDAAVGPLDPGHLRVRMDLGAVPVGAAGVAPDDRVVADDPARRVVERGHDRPGDVLRQVHLRAELAISSG